MRHDAFFADDSSDDTEDEATMDSALQLSLQGRLQGWVGRHNVTHAAVNDSLFVLKDEDRSLLVDARMLLETPRRCPIRQLSKGEYVHFGLRVPRRIHQRVGRSTTRRYRMPRKEVACCHTCCRVRLPSKGVREVY